MGLLALYHQLTSGHEEGFPVRVKPHRGYEWDMNAMFLLFS